MPNRRWLLALLLPTLLLATAGCMADQVVYVDEQGNELAVDGEGRPIFVEPSSRDMSPAPRALAAQPAADAMPPAAPRAASLRPAPVASSASLPAATGLYDSRDRGTSSVRPKPPVMDPSWGRAPAASVREPAPSPAPALAPKKVDSSAVLDLPPAG